MKFIHLTDTHVVGNCLEIYGANPARRLALAVDSINIDHDDAEIVIITGDLTHWGEGAAYTSFLSEVTRLEMPFALMVGNHDDGAALNEAIPNLPRDENGFVQQVISTSVGPFILTDTKAKTGHQGAYCADRLAWLDRQFEAIEDPALLFMHHPPFDVGIASMDKIKMQDGDALLSVLERHRKKVRQIFFGHLHRMVAGNWHGFPISIMRGLNHQVCLDLTGDATIIRGDLAQPAYGVVLVDDFSVISHMHAYLECSPQFDLHNLVAGDDREFALTMRHEGWKDFG